MGLTEVGDELVDVVDDVEVAGASGEGAHPREPPCGVAVVLGVSVGELEFESLVWTGTVATGSMVS